MALYSELPVYKATYDLLLGIFRFTKEFGKEYKYTVGESLKRETIELLTLIYRANVKRDKQEVLQEARERIEVIRLFISLMKDMQQISVKQTCKNSKPCGKSICFILILSRDYLNFKFGKGLQALVQKVQKRIVVMNYYRNSIGTIVN